MNCPLCNKPYDGSRPFNQDWEVRTHLAKTHKRTPSEIDLLLSPSGYEKLREKEATGREICAKKFANVPNAFTGEQIVVATDDLSAEQIKEFQRYWDGLIADLQGGGYSSIPIVYGQRTQGEIRYIGDLGKELCPQCGRAVPCMVEGPFRCGNNCGKHLASLVKIGEGTSTSHFVCCDCACILTKRDKFCPCGCADSDEQLIARQCELGRQIGECNHKLCELHAESERIAAIQRGRGIELSPELTAKIQQIIEEEKDLLRILLPKP